MGKVEVEDAFQRLDRLTQEENRMAMARITEVTNRVKEGALIFQFFLRILTIYVFTGNRSRTELRRWLTPPNPSIDHNTACSKHHDGTAEWFIQGSTFDEWKTNGSLLWIRGNRMLLLPYPTCMIANGLSGFQRGLARVSFGT